MVPRRRPRLRIEVRATRPGKTTIDCRERDPRPERDRLTRRRFEPGRREVVFAVLERHPARESYRRPADAPADYHSPFLRLRPPVAALPRGTPLHSRTAPLCGSRRWKEWAGYFVVDAFDRFHDPEYHAVRSGAALFDVSPLHKYDFVGPEATAFTDRLITRNVARSKVGQVLYSAWCDSAGKLIQDGCFQRFADDRVRATAVDPSLPWFELVARGMEVRIEEVSEQYAALALQGPTSARVLNRLAEDDLSDLGFFRLRETRLGGLPVVVTRTGYTGDLGYELWAASEAAPALWDLLLDAGEPLGLRPAGMLALDRARVEAGFPLIEVDFWNADNALTDAQKSTPYEVGLGWAVSAKKGPFVGQAALLAERARGPSRFFVGIETPMAELERLFAQDDLAPEVADEVDRRGVPVYSGRSQVGRATSVCWSPLLKRQLALATVERGYEKPGTPVEIEVTVEYERRRARSRVSALPFFDPPRKRRTPAV